MVLRGPSGAGRTGLLQSVYEIAATASPVAHGYWPLSLIDEGQEPHQYRDILEPSSFTVPQGVQLPYLWLGLSGNEEQAILQADRQLRAHADPFSAALKAIDDLPRKRLAYALNTSLLIGGLIPVIGPLMQALDQATDAIHLAEKAQTTFTSRQSRLQESLSTTTLREFSERANAEAAAADVGRLLAELTRWVPVAVVADDADGLDEISIAALNSLVRAGASRVLLVLAVNTDHHPTHPHDLGVDLDVVHNEELHAFLSALDALGKVTVIDLPPWTSTEMGDLVEITLSRYNAQSDALPTPEWAKLLTGCAGSPGKLTTLLSHGHVRAALNGHGTLPPDLERLSIPTATAHAWEALPASQRTALAALAVHGPRTMVDLAPPETVHDALGSGWIRPLNTGTPSGDSVTFSGPHMYACARSRCGSELTDHHISEVREALLRALTDRQGNLEALPVDVLDALLETLLHEPATRDLLPDRLTAAYLRMRRASGREAADLDLLNHLASRERQPDIQLLVATTEGLADAGYTHRAIDTFTQDLQRLQTKYGINDPCTDATVRNLAAAWTAHARQLPPNDRHPAYQHAIDLLTHLVELLQARARGPVDRHLPETRNKLAHLYADVFNYAQAATQAQKAAAELANCTDYGPNHIHTLGTRAKTAGWTGDAGQAQDALQLLEALLLTMERALGAEHPDTLIIRNNLAHWTGKAGQAQDALQLYKALLPTMERALGAEHPDTLTTRANLAHWTGQAGQAQDARELYKALLLTMERALGAEHPETLITRANIAQWTGEAGQAQDALQLFEALLPTMERALGAEHPETLITRAKIAHWTGEAGQAQDALQLFEALLPTMERALGAEHPDTLITRSKFAGWTGQAGQAQDARELYKALLPTLERVLGAEHPGILTTRNNLAYWTRMAGRAQDASEGAASPT